jgi:3-methyladenine DNA glycosylase AlkD
VNVPHVERMIRDLEVMEDPKEQSQLLDWTIANVIMKKSPLKAEASRWRLDPSLIKQRVYWSVQARSVRPANEELNEELLSFIEVGLGTAPEKVQWNMNWCAAQIGIADERLRSRCIALGEKRRLYEDYPTPKGCTSPYLPYWIRDVVAKQAGKSAG